MDSTFSFRFNIGMKMLTAAVSLAVIFTFAPFASAQTKLMPKSTVARTDQCAPIGRTANGELVYSMKCETIPAPTAPPQARIEEPAASVPPPQHETRSGLFGWSYDRRQEQ